jgi:hypothetical protein
MKITEIRNRSVQSLNVIQTFIPKSLDDITQTADTLKQMDTNDIAQNKIWQQDILKQGLEALENKLQMSNNGTILGKEENKPIESFEEAIETLHFIKTDLFAKQASNAQANVSPSVVYELLTEVA